MPLFFNSLIDKPFYFCCIAFIIYDTKDTNEDIMRTTKDNFRLFEDLARMAIGAAGSMTDVREQIKKLVKERLETVMSDMDMVSRSEFDRVKAMAEKARLRQEELEERLDALEGKGRSAAKTKKRKKAA